MSENEKLDFEYPLGARMVTGDIDIMKKLKSLCRAMEKLDEQ